MIRMRRINVTVQGELIVRAEAAGLNLSEVTRYALAHAIRLRDAEVGDDDACGEDV